MTGTYKEYVGLFSPHKPERECLWDYETIMRRTVEQITVFVSEWTIDDDGHKDWTFMPEWTTWN